MHTEIFASFRLTREFCVDRKTEVQTSKQTKK